MKRSSRQQCAKQTVEIVERGSYVLASGRSVDLQPAIQDCLDGTRLYSPAELQQLRDDFASRPAGQHSTTVEVVNETTLCGIARLHAASPGRVAALNFASAKNPGGGFLSGSQAQEESLARSSALHASLFRAWDFYQQHRAAASLLYSDAMILSPNCPIFRDDDGALLDQPQQVAFITSAAPNAGAAVSNQPEALLQIPEVFRRRSEYVLTLAAAHGYTHLVLGAWGCGVFRNNPKVVAAAFANHLLGAWAGRFKHVLFSVLDHSESRETFAAFREALSVTGA